MGHKGHMQMKIIKKPIATFLALLLTLCFSLALKAEKQIDAPSSNVAWDAAAVNFVRNGNVTKGGELNKSLTCSVCHGEKGVSAARNWPNLAGQNPFYIYKQLLDYKDNNGPEGESAEIMSALAASLSKQDMADLAQYYAQFTLPKLPHGNTQELADANAISVAKTIVNKGDGKRMIASCAACHGHKGEGEKVDMPALAGQQAVYLRNAMQEFKTGLRHNDIYSRMRIIAKSLTDEEINALAQYYAEIDAGSANPK